MSSRLPKVLKLSLLCSIIVVFLITTFEWLFHVTKISFLSGVGLSKLLLPITIPILFLVPILGLQIGVYCVARVCGRERLCFFLPGLLVASLGLLLFDNFTYTVSGWGVVNVPGWLNVFYAAGFLGASYWAFTRCVHAMALPDRTIDRMFSVSLFFLLVSFFVTTGLLVKGYTPLQTHDFGSSKGAARRLPNILLVTIDGLESGVLDFELEKDAQSSSDAIGSEFPILRQIVAESLTAENFYTTAGFTTPALLSLLSGRSPFAFKVYYAPFTLQKEDSYKHLPMILRNLGYKSAQFGALKFVSAKVQGMKDGFDEVNLRLVGTGTSGLPSVISRILWLETNFVTVLSERMGERLRDIFGLEAMQDPMADVSNRITMAKITDSQRIDEAIRFMDEYPKAPKFIHIHIMNTHPPHNSVLEYKGKIRNVLRNLEERLFATLKKSDMIDDALIVISSDHTWDWKTLARLPLYIKFPEGRPRSVVKRNADTTDVAPTLLEYLGVEIPEWMTGSSLIADGQEKMDKPILGVFDVETDVGLFEGLFEAKENILKVVSFIKCKRAMLYNVRADTSEPQELSENSSRCEDGATSAEMLTQLKAELARHGIRLTSNERAPEER